MQGLLILLLHRSLSLQIYLPFMKFSVQWLLWQSHSPFFSYLLWVITHSSVLSPKYHCRSIFCFLLMLPLSQSKLPHLFLGIPNISLHSPSRTILSLHYTLLFEVVALCKVLHDYSIALILAVLPSEWYSPCIWIWSFGFFIIKQLPYLLKLPHILHIKPFRDDLTRWEARTSPVMTIAKKMSMWEIF